MVDSKAKHKKRRLKIAVLMGGPSSERAISFMSGNAVCQALEEVGYEVVPIDAVDEWEDRLKKTSPDVAFIALHGKFGEDGGVQSILENLQVPYTGSGVTASRLAMDKIASRQLFKDAGIPVPEYTVVSKNYGDTILLNYGDTILNYSDTSKNYEGTIFPVVVKPSSQGSSIGLTIVNQRGQLKKAIDLAFAFDEHIIIERYIAGREITVGVLNERPLPVIQIVPKRKFYDYKAKYLDSQTQYLIPAPIPQKVYKIAQRLAIKAHNVLGCRAFSRTDMILGDDNIIRVLEVNSIPGLTSISLLPKAAACAGINFRQMCRKIVELALKRYNAWQQKDLISY